MIKDDGYTLQKYDATQTDESEIQSVVIASNAVDIRLKSPGILMHEIHGWKTHLHYVSLCKATPG